jgi:lipoteichoic acid synthase
VVGWPPFYTAEPRNRHLASIKGVEKYIYHYDNQPEEVFDLSKDPQEQRNLAGEISEEELAKRRDELLKWHSGVNATYAFSDG